MVSFNSELDRYMHISKLKVLSLGFIEYIMPTDRTCHLYVVIKTIYRINSVEPHQLGSLFLFILLYLVYQLEGSKNKSNKHMIWWWRRKVKCTQDNNGNKVFSLSNQQQHWCYLVTTRELIKDSPIKIAYFTLPHGFPLPAIMHQKYWPNTLKLHKKTICE